MFEVNKLNDSSMIEQLSLFFHNKGRPFLEALALTIAEVQANT